MKTAIRVTLNALAVVGVLACSTVSLAQIQPPDLNLDTGIKPFETYDAAQENVSIASGNLEVEIPLVTLPGRNGHDFVLKLVYNSQNWSPTASVYRDNQYNGSVPDPSAAYINWNYPQPNTYLYGVGSTGWQLNIPVLYAEGVTTPPACSTWANGCWYQDSWAQTSQYTNFYLVMGDGRKYQFPYASFLNWQTTWTTSSGGNPDSASYFTQPEQGSDVLIDYDSNIKYGGYAGDGVMLDLTNAASGTGTAVVRFRDGSQLLFPIGTTQGFTQPVVTNQGTPDATSNDALLPVPASEFVDANGNVTSYGPAITSSTGVTIGAPNAQSATCPSGQTKQAEYSYWNSNGQPEAVTLCLSAQFPSVAPSWQSPTTGGGIVSVTSGWIGNMLASVVLPDNLAYTFQYNAYGELTEITYPSGGYTRYTYSTIPSANQYVWTSDISGSADRRVVTGKYSCSGQAVTSWTSVPSGYNVPSGNPSGTPAANCPVTESATTYTWTSRGMAVVDPLGNETDYTFGGATCSVQPVFGPDAGFLNFGYGIASMEISRTVYQGAYSSGKQPLRTVYSNYNSGCQPELKTSEMTVLPSGIWNETTWAYDTAVNQYNSPAVNDHNDMTNSLASAETDNMVTKSEYGFGAGPAPTPPSNTGNPIAPSLPLVRKTVNTYLSQGMTTVNGVNYEVPPVYILNRLAQQTIYNGSGGQVSQTTYTYDSGNLSGGSSVQHGTTFSSYGTGYATRGNVTSISKWIGSGQSNAVTQYQYDTSGNVVWKTDPLGHSTQYNFSDAWGNSTCAPSGGSADAFPSGVTNAAGQTTNYTWNSCTGTMSSAKNPNGGTTSLMYDAMDRRIQANYPDGGETQLQYSDDTGSPFPLKITETKYISSNSANVSTIFLDGLSRAWETQQTDPQGTDTVITAYDAAGNVACVTNPFRGTDTTSVPISCNGYDALQRKVVQTRQDNSSTLQSCYDGVFSNVGYDFTNIRSLDGVLHNGNPEQNPSLCSSHLGSQLGEWVDSTDENGNHWQRTSDALGRLVAVFEPSSTSPNPSMETDYTYDTLDDLTNVNQHGNGTSDTQRLRSFTYDGLSRLLCAQNPENSSSSAVCPSTYSSYVTGTTGYSYDADSNLTSKTDARGVTTSYGYDSINRLIAKNYSNAPAGSLSSCYSFDTAANGIGLLGFEWTQSTSCPSSQANNPPSSGYQSRRVIGSYDAMGRIVSEQQCLQPPAGQTAYCTSSAPPQPPAPNCTSLAVANGLSYCYDLAGDLIAFTGGLNNSQISQQNIMFAQGFDSVGRVATMSSSWSPTQFPPNLFTVNPTNGYTPAGALQSWGLGSKVNVTKTYDNRLRVTSESATQQ